MNKFLKFGFLITLIVSLSDFAANFQYTEVTVQQKYPGGHLLNDQIEPSPPDNYCPVPPVRVGQTKVFRYSMNCGGASTQNQVTPVAPSVIYTLYKQNNKPLLSCSLQYFFDGTTCTPVVNRVPPYDKTNLASCGFKLISNTDGICKIKFIFK